MCTEKSIFMIADQKIVDYNEDKENIQKVIQINKYVFLSFWGDIEFGEFKLLDKIKEFKTVIQVTDSVSVVAEKLKIFLQNLKIWTCETQLGLHLTGYENNRPVLRHVFHETWLPDNFFINEDCRFEYHDPVNKDPSIFLQGFKKISKIDPYPILFNGENSVPNLVINGMAMYKDKIDYSKFSRDNAKEFMLAVMRFAIKLQDFRDYFIKELKNVIIGFPINFCEIKPNGEFTLEEINE
jgi:hypothetical protein